MNKIVRKEDLMTEFSLDEAAFKETIKYCKFRQNKEKLSEEEKALFSYVRELVNGGNPHEEIIKLVEEFLENRKSQGLVIEDNSVDVDEPNKLLDDLQSLQAQAIQNAADIGFQHAQIMAKVIPQFTIMRLQEMIHSGELKQNFQKIWKESTKELGKPEILKQQIRDCWNQRQIQISQIEEDEEDQMAQITSKETEIQQNFLPQSNSPDSSTESLTEN